MLMEINPLAKTIKRINANTLFESINLRIFIFPLSIISMFKNYVFQLFYLKFYISFIICAVKVLNLASTSNQNLDCNPALSQRLSNHCSKFHPCSVATCGK